MFNSKITRGFRNMSRLAQISNILARNGFSSFIDKINLSDKLTPEQFSKIKTSGSQKNNEINTNKGFAYRLRISLEELGPAFIKLGQLLASREDLLPDYLIVELQKLHSSVIELDEETINKILNSEFSKEKFQQFKEINKKALASGSIAQIHQATLITGENVVIKIQRPNLRMQINTDLDLIEDIANLIEKYIPELRFSQPKLMVNEFKKAILGELDFIREAGNIIKFTKNFEKVNSVKLPKIYWELCSDKIITMEELKGLKPWNKEKLLQNNIDLKQFVKDGQKMFLKMVFIDGLFHGDLHPGNIIALPGNVIGLFDFGVTVRLSQDMRENLAALLTALVEENYERVVFHYLQLIDSPDPKFNAKSFEYELSNIIGPYINVSIGNTPSTKIYWQLARIAAKHGATMPHQLILFARTLAAFEGLSKRLDPEFDIFENLKEFTNDIISQLYTSNKLKSQAFYILKDLSQLARSTPVQLRKLITASTEEGLNLNVKLNNIQSLESTLAKNSRRLSISIIFSAIILAIAILLQSNFNKDMHYLLEVFRNSKKATAQKLEQSPSNNMEQNQE